jgi:hypothetical protein
MQGCLALTLIVAPIVCAADEPAEETTQSVIITGTKGGALLSYRFMLAGLDAFDEYHDLAPNADKVYFRLKLNKEGHETPENVSLHITGDTVSIPVPIAPDGTFTVPRSEQADNEDADLVLNKPKKDYLMHIGIFSPGVPENMRRLGDLRLECEVGMAMAKNKINFFLRATISTWLLTNHWCRTDKFKMPVFADRPISSAVIINGGQRTVLVVLKGGYGYEAPINDKNYPDDDLIEFQFIPEPEDSKN